MKKFLFLIVVFLCIEDSVAQLLDSANLSIQKEYISITKALENPDKVYKLNLRKQKLDSIPSAVFELKNLQILVLSKNKLTELPNAIGNLIHLQIFDISANKIETIPSEIGNLTHLKELILNRNNINKLPSEFSNLYNLEYLDLWSNEIFQFPVEITKLAKSLKIIDMRVIAMNLDDQEKIRELLPYTTILFSKACNCK